MIVVLQLNGFNILSNFLNVMFFRENVLVLYLIPLYQAPDFPQKVLNMLINDLTSVSDKFQ